MNTSKVFFISPDIIQKLKIDCDYGGPDEKYFIKDGQRNAYEKEQNCR